MSTRNTLVPPSSPEWSMLSLADKDPFPAYDALRERGQIVWDPEMKCWLVLSYALCKEIESNEDAYRIVVADAPPLAFEIKGGRTALTSLLGTDHSRMRRLYLKLLGPAAMAQYRDVHVLPVIDDAIDRFAERGKAELVSEFSEVVPARVMASMFHLQWKDDGLIADLARWHRDIVAWAGMGFAGEEVARKAKSASDALNDLFTPLVLERRDRPQNDIISRVWAEGPSLYGPLEASDVVSIVRDIEIGAGETTSNAIANLFYVYLSNSELHDAINSGKQYIANALVEETLRLYGSVQWRFRVSNDDVSVGGVEIRKDDKICLLHAAANRDPEHYSCPHELDTDRKALADHLAFNVGSRVCPGMWLARLKLRESLQALVTRLPETRLDDTKPAPSFRDFSHRSFGPLNVVF